MGRPCKLTPEAQERIVNAVRNGCYRETAATLGGVDDSTLYLWLREGKETKTGPKFDLFNAVKKAEAEWEAEQIAGIEAAGIGGAVISRTTTTKKDGSVVITETLARPEWTARAWLLERKLYDRWAKKERLELSGDERRPLRIEYVVPVTGNEGGK
jgi:transposase-like protein